jgi:hypothetical protein
MREEELDDAFLGADERQHFGLGIERDAEGRSYQRAIASRSSGIPPNAG